jgi:hypothetical protein
MPDFKVTEVQDRTRDWDGKGGSQWTSYYVKCEGDERLFEVVKKRGNDGPKVGAVIDAEIETREHNGTTYYKLKPNGQGGPGGGYKGKSAEERRSIARQHAQKVAMQYAEIKGEKGDLPEKYKVGDLRPIIHWLYEDVLAAEKGEATGEKPA